MHPDLSRAMLRVGDDSAAGDLWAKAAELERDFVGYKRRLAERRTTACAVAAAVVGDGAGGAEQKEQSAVGEVMTTGMRGRRYNEYVRRRDERLRQEWHARMEAEMKALQARLDRATNSHGRRGEVAAAARRGRDHQRESGSLEVKVKTIAPATPRCSPGPATKTPRPRTSVPPSSPAAASPRLSTPDVRRRPSHLQRHSPQAAEPPPSIPPKQNRLPPPPPSTAPATPRPRTTLPRTRSKVVRDRGGSSAGRESPRPPRVQDPQTRCDDASNGNSSIKEALLSREHDDAVVVPLQRQSRPCFSKHDLAHLNLKMACSAATPLPFHHGRSIFNGAEPVPVSSLLSTPKDETDCSETLAPSGCNADKKGNNDGDFDRSFDDKSGSADITGDSDTEPSYVYIKRDSGGEQTSRSSQVSTAAPGTCPQADRRSEDKAGSSCNLDSTTAASSEANPVAGESPVASDASEEARSRRASSESLYSNVRSSFSQRSGELDDAWDATNSPLLSPPSCAATPPVDPSPVDDDAAQQPKENPEEEDAGNSSGSSGVTVSITVQSPMDAMAGLRRFLTFGRKSGKAAEAATTVVERPPAADRRVSTGCPIGDSVKARRTCSSSDSNGVTSDESDNGYVLSTHVRSLQSFATSHPASHELKEAVLHAKSPKVHRSFFSLSSFKSRTS